MKQLLNKFLSLPAIKTAALFFLRKPGKPLYLAVGIHAEKIYDAAVYEKLAELGRSLPFKAAAFVMTPLSPITRAEMEKDKVTEETFTVRLKLLAGLYEIGLHGHFCKPKEGPAPGRETFAWLLTAGFERTWEDPVELGKQFRAEYGYLAANVDKPKMFCAGWWFLNERIVRLLEEYGFDTDCSILHGQVDSFGGHYLGADSLPGNGEAFILPPSQNVAEFPSVPYLDMAWWRLVLALLPLLFGGKGPLFAVLPVHDNGLPEQLENIRENIRLLSRIRNVEFVPLSRMRELAIGAGLAAAGSPAGMR
jgi:hypothetical protein